jgi:hypothetical protein
MSPNEREYLDSHGPTAHARVSGIIGRIEAYSMRVPSRLCDCDVDRACVAHRAASTYAQVNKPERLTRFLRLVEGWRR